MIRARDEHRTAEFLADILDLHVGTATPPFLLIQTDNRVTLDVLTCAPNTITSQHQEFAQHESPYQLALG
jgi:hypothetical protein